MGKSRKHQRYTQQHELPRSNNQTEGRMNFRHHGFSSMFPRDADRLPRDGDSSGLPPHGWSGQPPYRSHSSSMQYPSSVQQTHQFPAGHGPGLPAYPPSEMGMRVMPANVPNSYFQRRQDNRGLRHRLFNEDYRYAGPQQVYAPPDVNSQIAELVPRACSVSNGVNGINGAYSFRLRGDAPEFVPREKSNGESAVHNFDQAALSDPAIKVEELGLGSDEGRRNSSGERVAWLVVSSTR